MRIRICDICGAKINDYEILSKSYDVEPYQFKVKVKMIYKSNGYLKTMKYDLCAECMVDIAKKIREESGEVSECLEENNAE